MFKKLLRHQLRQNLNSSLGNSVHFLMANHRFRKNIAPKHLIEAIVYYLYFVNKDQYNHTYFETKLSINSV